MVLKVMEELQVREADRDAKVRKSKYSNKTGASWYK